MSSSSNSGGGAAAALHGAAPLALFVGTALLCVAKAALSPSGARPVPSPPPPSPPTPPRSVLVVGIAGGSGSGKTTLSRALYDSLGASNCAYIMHDSYYKDVSGLTLAERERLNYDHPDQLDTALLVEHVRGLKSRQGVDIPTYDFATHSRTSTVTRLEPRPVVIVEGILIFTDPVLCELLDLKVFVDADCDVRLLRRIERDTAERGRSFQSVVEQYLTTVRPMYHKFVKQSRDNADLVVPSHSGIERAHECIVARLHRFLAETKSDD